MIRPDFEDFILKKFIDIEYEKYNRITDAPLFLLMYKCISGEDIPTIMHLSEHLAKEWYDPDMTEKELYKKIVEFYNSHNGYDFVEIVD